MCQVLFMLPPPFGQVSPFSQTSKTTFRAYYRLTMEYNNAMMGVILVFQMTKIIQNHDIDVKI